MSRPTLIAAALAATLALAAPAIAQADTFTVNSTADAALAPGAGCHSTLDGGPCTLRAAMQAASSTDDDSTIDVPAGTYDLTIPQVAGFRSDAGDVGNLALTFGDGGTSKTVTVEGAGAGVTVVQGDWAVKATPDRVLEIEGLGDANQTLTVNISGLTFSGGDATSYDGEGQDCPTPQGGGVLIQGSADVSIDSASIIDNKTGDAGGGIGVAPGCGGGSATVSVTNSTISGNSANAGGGFAGAGTYAFPNEGPGISTSTYTFTGDTFSANTATTFGGAYLGQAVSYGEEGPIGDVATFANDTISGNTAQGGGGGIDLQGFTEPSSARGDGIVPLEETEPGPNPAASLTNVTLDANQATGDEAEGGDIRSVSGNVTLENSIVTDGSPDACHLYADPVGAIGAISSLGHNIFDDASCGPIDTDLSTKTVSLDKLMFNGGSTATQELPAGSPAISFGDPKACPKTDQRGVTRKSPCDAGAYETVPVATTTSTTTTTTTTSRSSTTTSAPPPAATGGVLGTKTILPPLLPKPGPRACVSLRHFRIHIQNVRSLKIVRADVYVDGRRVAVIRRHGHRFVSFVDLRNLPRGKFTVKILARLRDGRLLQGKRTYHTCRKHRLPGHSALLL